jgi:hypothetical protein
MKARALLRLAEFDFLGITPPGSPTVGCLSFWGERGSPSEMMTMLKQQPIFSHTADIPVC